MKLKTAMITLVIFHNMATWGEGVDLIDFTDANVKALCVANWDTNGDGELSEEEAAAVNSIGTVFQNQAEITSFSEFKFFTSVTTIGQYALSGCTNLATIEFPSSLQTFDRYACYNSGFENIVIPENVTSIGNSAFRSCTTLSSIKFGKNTVSFGKNVFRYCTKMASITFDGTECHFDGEDAFRDCNVLTSIIITDVSAWCKSSFSYTGSNPLSITRSLSLQTADNEISVIKDLVIPDDVTTINNNAFFMCESLESVAISNKVTSIGSYAFYGCNGLTSVVVHNGLTSIGSYAFYGCSALSSIVIPNSVTSIGSYAFAGCTNLTSVRVEALTPVTIDSYTFSNRANATLNVPYGSKAAYEAANYWKEFKEIVEMEGFIETTIEGVDVTYTVISEEEKTCKVGYTYVKKKGQRTAIDKSTSGIVTIPATVNGYAVKGIGDYAFDECANLTSIVIPDGVTYIGESAFFGCKSLTSIVVPEGVTSIGESAFAGCTNAVTIDIPNSVRGDSFGDYTFAGCESLTAINIPEGVSRIGSCAFRYCKSLKSVTIPSTVSTIYEFAFEGCASLASVTLSENMKYIGTSAFSGSSITSLTLPKSFTTSSNVNNISYSGTEIGDIKTLKKVVINKGVGSLYEVFQYCGNIETIICYNETPVNASNCWRAYPNPVLYVPEGSKEAYMADDNWNKLTIVEMKPLSFVDANVKNICVSNWDTNGDGDLNQLEVAEITDLGMLFQNKADMISFNELKSFTSLTTIGENAFSNCSGLNSITIPSSVKVIDNNAFENCTNLTSVSVENPLPCTLASNAFPNRANATLYVPAGSKATYSSADYWKEFKAIVEIDASSMNITFADAAVKALCIAKDGWDANGDGELSMAEASAITDLGNTFYSKSIKSFNELQYFTGISAIGNEAFRGCRSLESIVLPMNIITIENYAFMGCDNLATVNIPNQVTAINDGAFSSCSAISSFIIPKNVASIGVGAFSGCSGLNSIIVEDGNQIYDSRNNCNALIETATNTIIKGTKSTIIPNDITSIGASAFYYVRGLTEINIPHSVTSIGSGAFSGCSDLTSIILPDGISTIEKNTFFGCGSLASIIIPQSVTSLGDAAFEYCSSLKAISIPEGVANIGGSTFEGCSNLTTITIPEGVTSMNYYAFKDCKSLESISLPSSISSIANGAFEGCYNILKVTTYRKKPVSINTYNTFPFRSNATLYVPYGCKANYERYSYWQDFKEIIELSVLKGDVNDDGNVDAQDASLVLQYVAKKIDSIFGGDVNDDGAVDAQDASLILQYVAKKITW